MRAAKNVPSSIKGVTLVELMVMSVIASLVAITVIQGFSGISKGIIASRFKSLGTQLANEKMQLIKSTPYYRLLVSSQTVVPTGLGSLTPTVQSDEFNHPPTVSIVNGVTFTAYTRVQRVAKNSAETLDVVSWNAPETGIKQITVDVVWTERNTLRRSRLINLLENSSRLVANGVFVGEVWNGTSFLPNALVETLEDSSLKVLSDAGGNYRLNAPVGTYTLRASKRGFFPETIFNCVITNSAPQTTVNFTNLVLMSSGTVSGSVWHNDHLVISRVCANKSSVGGEMQEYVEIFNPTTWTWTVDGQIGLMFQRRLVQDPQPIPIAINYAGGGNTIAPNKFFLFASSTTIDISGAFRVADATWDQTGSAVACNLAAVNNDACFPYFDSTAVTFDIIPYNDVDYPTEGAGVLTLYVKGSGIILDRVGWDGPGAVSPAFYETSPMMTGGGIKNGQVIYRKNTPPGGWDETVGPAYDSNNNNLDLQLAPAIPHFPPRNTSSAALPIKAGVPSVGAFVFANDGLSQLVQAIAAGSPPEAKFTLPNIATGTWTVNASTANYFLSFSTSVMAGVTVSTSLILNTPAQYGFLSGYIKDTTNQVISNIYVNPGNGRSDLTGFYRIAAPPGFQKIFGNPNQENPNFVQTSCMVNVPLAKETGYNISLNIAGKISGWVTTDGTTPLPGISVKALNQYGGINQVASTGHDGRFELKVDSTGDYSILPAPSAGESVVPASKNVTISGGTSSVFVGTFTVSSNLGTLAGSVTAQGKPISTGVYIIASTGTVPATPPVIDHSFRQSGTVFLSGSSRSDGTYSLPVTPGTYTVAAWYTTLSGNTPTVVRKDFSNIVVSANQKTTLNIPW